MNEPSMALPATWFPPELSLPAETLEQFQRFANLSVNSEFSEYAKTLQSLLDDRFAELSKALSANVIVPKFETPVLPPAFLATSERLAESFARIPVIDPQVLASLASNLHRLEPSNFADFNFTNQIRIVELSLEHSFGSLEALPTELIADLSGSDGSAPAVEALLSDHSTQVADHCQEALAKVKPAHDPDGLSTLAIDAARSLRMEHNSSAQALATVIWDSLLTKRWNGTNFVTQIKKTTQTPITKLGDDGPLRELYWKAWLGPAVIAYQRPQVGDRYSRNGTIHHAAPRRFGPVHAVQALTIATSLLCYTRI